jgi:hypothetical protein
MRTGQITQARVQGWLRDRAVKAGAHHCQTCQLRRSNIPWGIHEQLSCSERGRRTLSQVQDSLSIPLTIRRGSYAYVERSTNSNIAYLCGLPSLAGNFIRSRQKSAHKDGLAVRVYYLLFTCAESGVHSSDCRGVSRIQCDFCERHRIRWESYD